MRGGDGARVARGEESPGLPISPEAHQTRQRGSSRAQSQLTSVHADADASSLTRRCSHPLTRRCSHPPVRRVLPAGTMSRSPHLPAEQAATVTQEDRDNLEPFLDPTWDTPAAGTTTTPFRYRFVKCRTRFEIRGSTGT